MFLKKPFIKESNGNKATKKDRLYFDKHKDFKNSKVKPFYSKLHTISIKQNELDISFIPIWLLSKCNTKWFSSIRPV